MTATQAFIGYGSVVEMADPAAPTIFTYLSESKSITLPSDATDQVDATHMQSPNRTKEFIPGIVDAGEFSFESNYVPGSATDVALEAAKGKTRIVRVTFPNGRQLIFNAFVLNYDKTLPMDDVATATVTFKVSGAPTLTGVAAPRNISLPVISGSPVVGSPLTVDWGVWAGAKSFAFQWQAEGVDISGATGSSYIPVTGDIGDVITVEVTGSNDSFDTMAESAATVAVS